MNENIEKSKLKSNSWIWLFLLVIVILICIVQFVGTTILNQYYDESDTVVDAKKSSQESREEQIKQDALDYLNERYGEEFVIESIRGTSYAYDYINMYAYPESHQEEAYMFKIQGRYNEEGILEYTDSYVMIKLRDEYEAYIDPIIDEYFDEYKFYMDFDSEWITSNIPADAKLEDLWELDANMDYPLPEIHLYLTNQESERYSEEVYMQLAEQLQKKEYRGILSVTIYYNDIFYNKRNRENVYEDIGARGDNVNGVSIFIYNEQIKVY